jgi:hypothetical protein
MHKLAFALGFFAIAAPLAAQEPATVARIEIRPSRVESTVGDTVRLTATPYDADGRQVAVPLQWFTSYEVGTIDSTGTFVAYSPGERTIGAAAGGHTATIPVVVASAPPARVEVIAPATHLTATSWIPIAVHAYNSLGGRTFDTEDEVTWTSSDPRVADVVGGFLEARRPGTVTVTATTQGVSGSIEVMVEAANPGQLAITAPESSIRTGDVYPLAPTIDGQPLQADAFPRYTVTGPIGAKVYPDGAFVAEEPGAYVVVADYGGSSATVGITVTPREHEHRLETVGHMGVPTAHTADIWVFEDVAYLGTFMDDKLRVYDISDPASPVLTDSIQVDARRINDVMANPGSDFAIMTREGAANRINGFVILDTSDPKHPRIAGEYTATVSGGVHTTWIVDDLVYATHNGTGDMRIIDVSDRANPREVGRWGVEHQNRVLHDIFIKDGVAYLSYWDDGLVMLDLGGAGKGGTPTNPVFISRINYPEGNTHTAWRWKNYVFVGDEIFPTNWNMDRPIAARGFIHVIDVTDIENPVEVAKYEVPEAGAHNIWIDEDEEVLYIAYYQAGLRALDVSGELRGDLYAQGREIDRFLTTASEGVVLPNVPFAGTVMLHDGLIYTVDFNSGLWIHRMTPTGDRPIS